MKKRIMIAVAALAWGGLAAAQDETVPMAGSPVAARLDYMNQTLSAIYATLQERQARPRPGCIYADKHFGKGSIVRNEAGTEIVCMLRTWGVTDRDDPDMLWMPVKSNRAQEFLGNIRPGVRISGGQ